MANTGNTQQQINYGAAANDGQGDPLRTAFVKTDDNFDAIWNTGPVGSNITILNNTIQANNTNGNLVLKPNGVGVVQTNSAIVPNAANLRDLGTSAVPFRSGYFGAGGLDVNGAITTVDLTVASDATINGNLTIDGDVIQIGNLVTDAKTIQLANTATTDAAANGAGVTVGANDDIATLLYNSTDNEWRTNIGANVTGNVTGTYFIGNGALLTGISSSYGNANVADYLVTYTGNISAGNIFVANNISVVSDIYATTATLSGDADGRNAIYAGYTSFTNLGSDVVSQFSGNVDAYVQFNFQNASNGAQATGDYVITADNGDDESYFLNIGLTGSNWDGTQDNSLGNRLAPNDGYFYVQDGNLVVGTKSVGNIASLWKWTIDGNVDASTSLRPTGNLAYDIGTSANRWNNVYADSVTAANILNAFPVNITSNNSTWQFAENILRSPTGGTWESAAGTEYFSSNSNGFVEIHSQYLGNIVSDITVAHNDVKITLQNGGPKTWEFNVGGEMLVPGDIIPSANATYSLGNSSNYWSNVWVASNTIYIGGVPLGVSGNVLTVNGEAVLSNDSSSSITTTGNLSAGNISTGGAITATSEVRGQYFSVYNPDYRGDLGFSGGNLAMTANVAFKIATDYFASGESAPVWTFNTTGDLTAPGNITTSRIVTAGYFSGNGSLLTSVAAANVTGLAAVATTGDYDDLTNKPTIPTLGNFTFTNNTIETGNGVGGITLYINGPDQASPDPAFIMREWTFANTGAFTSPGAISATGNITASANINAAGGTFTANITSTGNIATTRNVDVTGFIYTNVISGRNSGAISLAASNVDVTTGNVNFNTATAVKANVIIATGNITGANLVTAATVFADAVDANSATIDGNLVVDGNVTATADLTLRAGAGGTINFPVTGGNIEFDAATGNVVFPGGVYTGDIVTTGIISATGNVSGGNIIAATEVAVDALSITNSSIAAVTQFTISTSNTATGNSSSILMDRNGVGVVVQLEDTGGGPYSWGLYQDNILFPDGSRQYSAYGNANVVANLAALGSNPISTTGNITAGNINANVAGYSIGYREIPQVALSANANAALSDSGKHFYSTTAGNLSILIPTNANVAFPTGSAFTVVVQAAGNVLINADSGVTLYMAGSSSAGNRIVGAYGMATVMKVASDTWFINGSGVY